MANSAEITFTQTYKGKEGKLQEKRRECFSVSRAKVLYITALVHLLSLNGICFSHVPHFSSDKVHPQLKDRQFLSFREMAGIQLGDAVSREVLIKSVRKFTKRSDVRLTEEAEVNMATSGVDGLLSTVLRVTTFYSFEGEVKTHSKRFIFKILPITKFHMGFLKYRGLFQREISYFERVVPMMEVSSAGRVQIPLPKCYHGVNDVIVMEDLTDGGYRIPDRIYLPEGLDYAHCRLAMRCLGRLHGLGVKAEKSLRPEDGNWLGVFSSLRKEAIFYAAEVGEMESPAKNLTEKAMETVLELSKEIDGLPMEVAASGGLEKVVKGAWRTCCRLVEPNLDGANVLCHGDYWTLNLKFKYEGDNSKVPVDVKAIDLQLAKYCHPCVDILYFMHVCTSKRMRDAHFEELLSVYHDSLVETLEAVDGGPPPMTFAELRRDVRGKYKPFGAVIGAVFAPGMLLGDDFVPQNSEGLTSEILEELFETGNSARIRERFRKDPKFKSRMTEIIREFVEMAFPDGTNTIESSPLIARF